MLYNYYMNSTRYLPKNAVVTGAYALAFHNMISYYPGKMDIAMPRGTNTSFYKEYNVTTQYMETLKIGVEKIDNWNVHTIERLFVEFDSIPLENTIKSEGLKKLGENCNPQNVKKIYEQLKSKRKDINHARIEKYLDKFYASTVNMILSKNIEEQINIIREHALFMLWKMNIPVLLKGESTIEFFTNIKRSTSDIDTHSGYDNILNTLNMLSNDKYDLWFSVKENIEETLAKEKNIYKFTLIPKSRSKKLIALFNSKDNYRIPISFNVSYTSEDIRSLIDEYKLSKQRFKHFNGYSCLVFSREMLLAEKFQSIISKPEATTRTKDLIDIAILWDEINISNFKKWVFKKWNHQRDSKTSKEALAIIKSNVDRDLPKIKSNFDEALKMYDIQTNYEDCIEKIKLLAKHIVEE